ncbi:hypothetical protein V1282_005883 [Nitrobacteraceae bacterium AZCC 2146]
MTKKVLHGRRGSIGGVNLRASAIDNLDIPIAVGVRVRVLSNFDIHYAGATWLLANCSECSHTQTFFRKRSSRHGAPHTQIWAENISQTERRRVSIASRVSQQIVLLHQLYGDERYSLSWVRNGRGVSKIDRANSPIAVYAAGNVFDFDRDNIFTSSPVLEFCKGDALQSMFGNAFLDHGITPSSNGWLRLLPGGLGSKTEKKHFGSKPTSWLRRRRAGALTLRSSSMAVPC